MASEINKCDQIGTRVLINHQEITAYMALSKTRPITR